MWVRGLKQGHEHRELGAGGVAPRVGAWIETTTIACREVCSRSHPVWVRGLKLKVRFNLSTIVEVAPRVGAWIETVFQIIYAQGLVVAPRVGAWIETCNF